MPTRPGSLIGYGLIAAHAAFGGVNLMIAEMARTGLDRSAIRLRHARHRPRCTAAARPLHLRHRADLLGIATRRGAVGPRWASVCVLFFPISDMLLSNVPVAAVGDVVSNAFGVAGFADLGLHLLRMRSTDWETRQGTQPAPAVAGELAPQPA